MKVKKIVDEIKEIAAEKVDIQIDFEAIWAINKDVIVWIKIPSAIGDFPIMQRPDEDNYYMDHDIKDVQSWIPGSIYINLNNSANLTDNNTVIYGK